MSKPAEDRPEADVEEAPLPEAGAGPVAEVVAEAPVEAAPPPPVAAPFAPSPPSPARKRPRPASDAPIWLAAAFVSLLWGLAPIAFAVGYQQGKAPFDYEPFVLLVLGGMALGPAGLVWVAARLWVEARRLRGESQRAARLADEMVAPAVAAGIRAGEIATGLEAEIARAGQTANLASRKLEDLRAALEAESGRLDAAARLAGGSAETLATGLGRERERLEGLASGLDARTTAVSDAIARQARLVGEVSDLAETQLREAEASLTARSTDFTEAAGRLADAARSAADVVGDQAGRLEGAGASLSDHVSGVERTLDTRRNGLLAVAQSLRAEQEGLAVQSEAHLARLAEVGGQARLSAADMRDSAIKGGEALASLIQEAAAQFREFADAARAERDEFGQSTRHALEAVAGAAAQERERLESQTRASIEALSKAAEATRLASNQNAEAAREQVDQLAEAAFSAGQKANQVFEARLEEARSLIARSAQMVEEAGDATARRLEEGASAARRTLDELAGMLMRIEERVASLPERARSQAEQVREAVSESMDGLMDQARRTATETQAIDAAFQDRVRRNFEMLSEAVKMMGTVAATGAPPAPATAPAAPLARTPAPPAEPLPTPQASPGEDAPRRRLRLTPAASGEPSSAPVSNETFAEIFEAAGGPPEALDGLRPRALETSPADGEGGGQPQDKGSLDFLADEIRALGIDPMILLPITRVDELSAMIADGQGDSARELVRRLAPAATRKLSRRLLEEPRMRRSVMDFLARYQTGVETAIRRDRSGREVGALLSTEAGRLYLLAEAAAGDIV
jgi:hypothetical protein